jgi:para-aminobenzoate synthetase component II
MILKILLIDNYDSFTYNIVELLRQVKNSELSIVKNDALREVNVQDFSHIIISPGPDLPEASGQLMEFIAAHYKAKPILGICLGHQAIAQFFGAKLKNFKSPFHGETATLIQRNTSSLLNKLPETFKVGLYHSWYVMDKDIPPTLSILAHSRDGIIMALQHINYPIFGVQFHPESYMTEHGLAIIENFLAI